MANNIINGEYIEEMFVNGHKISAEVAKRDDLGHLISKFYLPRALGQEKLISGENIITLNGESILKSGNIMVYDRDHTYSRDETDYYLNQKIEIEHVLTLPEDDQKTNTIYIVSYTNELFIYANGQWVQIGILMPAAPQEPGSYTLTCVVDENGHQTYRWN